MFSSYEKASFRNCHFMFFFKAILLERQMQIFSYINVLFAFLSSCFTRVPFLFFFFLFGNFVCAQEKEAKRIRKCKEEDLLALLASMPREFTRIVFRVLSCEFLHCSDMSCL